MSIGGLIVLSLAMGLGAWLFFLWSVKSGQYEDPEGPKYRMLDDDEPPVAGSRGGARDDRGGTPGAGG